MISSRKNNRNNLEKINLEKKVDQFIEVGRQFVDGVSGTRPGKRRISSIKEVSRRNVNNVSKWVSEKVDSFFDEEEDDWYYQFEEDEPEDNIKNFSRYENVSQNLNNVKKRPLTAISLRQSDLNSIKKTKQIKSSDDNWPEASDLQINRWSRTSLETEPTNLKSNYDPQINKKGRNLPKSSRRRI